MRDLGTLGAGSSHAYGINDAGQVVGWADTAEVRHAFITGPDGAGMADLNSLIDPSEGIVLSYANGINNAGQVIASPVPEPGSYTLLLAGLALLGIMAARKSSRIGNYG
jgi:probable HAF family extracellular repeat protein